MFAGSLIPTLACLAAVANAIPQRGPWPSNIGDGFMNLNALSDIRCTTVMATFPVRGSIPTSWSVSTIPCTVNSTSTATTTITPSTVTTGVTVTSTTISTAPTTYYTSTEYATVTVTTSTNVSTTIISSSMTSTVEIATSTIAPPPGWLPVQSSLPGSSYSRIGSNDTVQKRAEEDETVPSKREWVVGSMLQGNGSNAADISKPQFVSCYSISTATKCSTRTFTSISTIVASTPTSTSTYTSVVTSIVIPSGFTTITNTLTATMTNTNTISVTSTIVATETVTSTTSVYAACATNNYFNKVNGQNIDNLYFDVNVWGYDDLPASTEYECCVATMKRSSPDLFFMFVSKPGQTACQVVTTNTYPKSPVPIQVILGTRDRSAFIFGNAAYGVFNGVHSNQTQS